MPRSFSWALILLVPVLAVFFATHPSHPSWEEEDIDLSHVRTAVVTGATSGIGRSVAERLARENVHVVAIGRSGPKLQKLQNHLGEERVTTVIADLSDLNAVDWAAGEIARKFKVIDLLINNAGMHQGLDVFRKKETKQGYDLVFGVNYLSHVLLTERLMPLLKESDNPRVVQVSSSFHWAVDGSDLRPTNSSPPVASLPGGHHGFVSFRSQRQYANSKFAQILHMRSLQRRHPEISTVSVCPAWVATQIAAREGSLGHRLFRSVAFDADGYGIASLMRAVAGGDDDGDYYINSSVVKRFSSIFPSWASSFSSLPLRDALAFAGSMVILAVQRRALAPAGEPTARSSEETYDVQLQDALDDWSRNVALEHWLSTSAQ